MTKNQPESAASRGKFARIAAEAWRDLGFWYECQSAEKRWWFRADREGAKTFAAIIRRFASNELHDEGFSHLHLGPFSNLRIIAAEQALISWRGIAGRRVDLERFAAELEALAASGQRGEHQLGADFAADEGFRVVLTLEPDGFDPAAADTSFAPPPTA